MPDLPVAPIDGVERPQRRDAAEFGEAAPAQQCSPKKGRCRARLQRPERRGREKAASQRPGKPVRSRRATRPRRRSAGGYIGRPGPAGRPRRSGCSGRSTAPGRVSRVSPKRRAATKLPSAASRAGRPPLPRAGWRRHGAPAEASMRQARIAGPISSVRPPTALGRAMGRGPPCRYGVRCFSICAARLRSEEKIRWFRSSSDRSFTL